MSCRTNSSRGGSGLLIPVAKLILNLVGLMTLLKEGLIQKWNGYQALLNIYPTKQQNSNNDVRKYLKYNTK